MDILDKKIEVIQLYDLYQNLLTDKQRQYVEAYYYEDMSLAEISDELEVSRNAIHDQIKRSVRKLHELENRLSLSAKNRKRNNLISLMKQEKNTEKIKDLIEELEKVE